MDISTRVKPRCIEGTAERDEWGILYHHLFDVKLVKHQEGARRKAASHISRRANVPILYAGDARRQATYPTLRCQISKVNN